MYILHKTFSLTDRVAATYKRVKKQAHCLLHELNVLRTGDCTLVLSHQIDTCLHGEDLRMVIGWLALNTATVKAYC